MHLRSCEGTSHEGSTVVTAPLRPQPIPKSNASPGLLAHITTSKFVAGLPLYRQEGILALYMKCRARRWPAG
jgi:transposase